MKFANIGEARKYLAGKVIVWYCHQLGGQLSDRWVWLAEKDNEVIDYHRKEVLISEAKKEGEAVMVLRLHKNGTVSAYEA